MNSGRSFYRCYLEIPEPFNMGYWAVDRHVDEGDGERIAVYCGGQSYTFQQLKELSNQFANVLRAHGVERGDAVMLRLETGINTMVAILGTLKAGAVIITTNPLFREHELEKILNNSDAVLAVTTPALRGPLDAVRSRAPSLHTVIMAETKGEEMSWERLMGQARRDFSAEPTGPNELAVIVYTSGTTGEPKGVEYGHRWIIGTGDPIGQVMARLKPTDICYQPQHWSFNFPLGCGFLYPFLAGASVVIPEGRFDAEKAFAILERHHVTVLSAVPTIYRMMLAVPGAESRFRLDSLRVGLSAGEPLPANTFMEWRDRLGVTILDGLGQSESHIFIANRIGMKVKPGSMGKPLPGYEVAILSDDGKPLAAGESGNLAFRNDHPGLTLGYHRNPERWAAVNRNGWYYTQDVAYIDDDGYFWYVSRADDLIKSRAYLISPKEVESALLEHPAVLEAAVVGVPDTVKGQLIKAFLTLKAGNEGSEDLTTSIKEHLRRVIALYKVPQEIEYVTELPKTFNGKILRRELRARS